MEDFFKKIEVERVVVDTFIESFKSIYLAIGKPENEFGEYCQNLIRDRFSFWKECDYEKDHQEEYRIIRDHKGEIIEMNIGKHLLRYSLKRELGKQKSEYLKQLLNYKTPKKEFIENNHNLNKAFFSLELMAHERTLGKYSSPYTPDFDVLLTPTDIFKDIIPVNSANKILREQGILKKNPEMKGDLPVDEDFSLKLNGFTNRFIPGYNSGRQANTSIRWTIKGAEEVRNVILNNLPGDKLDKYLEKKAQAK